MRFQSYHPALTLLFFAAAVFCALTWTHPALIAVSLVGASSYAISLAKGRGFRWVIGCLVFAVLWAIWFATYNHFGVTVLGETPIGNAITLEAVAFGADEGLRLCAAILWLFCAVQVFTADKVVYLLGRISPRLSLMCAVALRSAPMTASQSHAIASAQSGIGHGPRQSEGLFAAARHFAGRISTLITWCIDRALIMSDSMRARGSLLPRRSAYSLYRFDLRDRGMFLALVGLIALCTMGAYFGVTAIQLNPIIVWPEPSALFAVTCAGYLVFCLLPTALDLIDATSYR